MSLLAKLFGGRPKELVDSVGNVLDNLITNKEELAAAKLALEREINRHTEVMAERVNEIELAYLADVNNARALQKSALDQNDNFSKRFLYYLSSFVLISATGFGVMLFFVDFPEGNRRLVEMFADIYLFAGAIMVLQFFFGSSKGSHEKDYLLAKARENDNAHHP